MIRNSIENAGCDFIFCFYEEYPPLVLLTCQMIWDLKDWYQFK